MTKIQKFQLRRKMMISGFLIALFGVVFYISNTLSNFLPQSANLPVIIICICISLIAYMLYQCPYCGKYPEDTDVPLLDPKQCSKCEGRLK